MVIRMMIDKKEHLKKLYKDALYFHLIHKAEFTPGKAEKVVNKMIFYENEVKS